MGVKLPSFENFWKKGYFLYDVRPQERDYVAFANFRKDPKRNSLGTESGLIQIYSPKIASYGYKSCLGHPSYLEPTEASIHLTRNIRLHIWPVRVAIVCTASLRYFQP